MKKGSFILMLCLLSGCSPIISSDKKAAIKEKAIRIVEYAIADDYEPLIKEGSMNFRRSVTPEMMQAEKDKWPDVYGDFEMIDSCDIIMRDTLYIANVSVNFEHYKQMFMLALDSNLNLQGLTLK